VLNAPTVTDELKWVPKKPVLSCFSLESLLLHLDLTINKLDNVDPSCGLVMNVDRTWLWPSDF